MGDWKVKLGLAREHTGDTKAGIVYWFTCCQYERNLACRKYWIIRPKEQKINKKSET